MPIIESTGGTEPEAAEPELSAREESVCVSYTPDCSGKLIYINSPANVLYYPNRTLVAQGRAYSMGHLADYDKGCRLFYDGRHTGKLRLYLNQANRTEDVAIFSAEKPLRAILAAHCFPGVDLHYTIVLENETDLPASYRIQKQGGSVGYANLAQAEYYQSAPENTVTLAPSERKWLYLGREGDTRGSGPCKFTEDETQCIFVGHSSGDTLVETLAELHITGTLRVRVFAYMEKSKVILNRSDCQDAGSELCRTAVYWPLPANDLFDSTTGLSEAWQVDGNFIWTFSNATPSTASLHVQAGCGGPDYPGWATNFPVTDSCVTAEGKRFCVAGNDILPICTPVGHSNEIVMERLLFAPPADGSTIERRDAHNANLTNQGVPYRQKFTFFNNGDNPRRVRYYVTPLGEVEQRVCFFIPHNPKGQQVVELRLDGGSCLVTSLEIPPHRCRRMKTGFILSGQGNGGLGHFLTTEDILA
jgi:hypothetical protein